MIIQHASPADPAIRQLIQELDAFQATLYPAKSNHLEPIDRLVPPHATLVGAWEKNEPMGVGAVKYMGDYGEIKRMYVSPDHRGKGVARCIMAALEIDLVAQGIFTARLETGIHQTPAITLYESLGFARRDAFGDYTTDPLSTFMEKPLHPRHLMKIRSYEENDRDQVIALWQTCGLTVPWNDPHRDIQRKLNQNPDLFLMGCLGETIAATVMAGYEGHRGWLYYLAVAPDFQGMGLARTIVEYAESRLKAMGCPKVNLMVRGTNQGVLDVYSALGYRQDDVVVLSRRLETD